MDVLYFLVPVAIFLGLIGLILMVVAARIGQFDDLEGPAHRILFDDDEEMIPKDASLKNKKKNNE